MVEFLKFPAPVRMVHITMHVSFVNQNTPNYANYSTSGFEN